MFAKTAIAPGTRVVRYRGKPRWIWDIPQSVWSHCFQFDFDRYLVPKRGSPGWYINHSCEPNCIVRGERDLVAARLIGKGEEVSFDYSTNVGWEGFSMLCMCGARTCRGTVRNYDLLSPALKARYGDGVSPFLRRTGSASLEKA